MIDLLLQASCFYRVGGRKSSGICAVKFFNFWMENEKRCALVNEVVFGNERCSDWLHRAKIQLLGLDFLQASCESLDRQFRILHDLHIAAEWVWFAVDILAVFENFCKCFFRCKLLVFPTVHWWISFSSSSVATVQGLLTPRFQLISSKSRFVWSNSFNFFFEAIYQLCVIGCFFLNKAYLKWKLLGYCDCFVS